MSGEYGPRHPVILHIEAEKENIRRKIQIEIGNIIATHQNELSLSIHRQAVLSESLREAEKQSASMNQDKIELRQLEREAVANRELYQAFLKRLKETGDQVDLVTPDVKLLSLASAPKTPSYPKPKLWLFTGFTSSVLLGILISFLMDNVSRTFHTEEQVSRKLDAISLGRVPLVSYSGRGLNKLYEYILERPLSFYADAIRSIHKSISYFSKEGEGQKTILITSSLPNEGKSTLASSLAFSSARSGLKTVLIDGDLRHPSIAVDTDRLPEFDLVDYLEGEASIREVIYEADCEPNMDFIPIKKSRETSFESIESNNFKKLLLELKNHYERIIIDAPPVFLTDTRTAASYVDFVIFAVQWNRTKINIAQQGVNILRKCSDADLGIVLTRFDLKKYVKLGYDDIDSQYEKYKKYYVN